MRYRAGFLALASIMTGSAASAQPLSLHPENPHYFAFKGKPTVLVTSGEHYGAGHEVSTEHWDTPPPLAGTGSAGLGDLQPEEQRVSAEARAAPEQRVASEGGAA